MGALKKRAVLIELVAGEKCIAHEAGDWRMMMMLLLMMMIVMVM